MPEVPDGDDAVEEEHDLRAFAEHRDAADDGKRGQRALADGDRLADLLHLARRVRGRASPSRRCARRACRRRE